MHQGLILGPLLFSMYVIFAIIYEMLHFHFYVDDIGIYNSPPSLVQTIEFLQPAFDVDRSHLTQHKLVLNADKSKY